MNRAVLTIFAVLAFGLVALAIAPPLYHAFICRLCRRMRVLRREARRG